MDKTADLGVTDIARSIAAGAMAAAAMVHFAYAPPHFDDAASHGTFFVVAGWAQLILAAGLALQWRHPRRWLLATAVVNGAIVALWIVSRTTGIPGEDAEPAAFPDLLATGLEVVAVLASVALLLNLLADRALQRRPALGVGGAAALATMALVSMSVAPSFVGEHDHSGDHDADSASHVHGEDEMAAGHGHSSLTDHDDSDDHDDSADHGHDDTDGDSHDSDSHDSDSHDSDSHDDDDHDSTGNDNNTGGHSHRPTTTHPPDGHDHDHDPGTHLPDDHPHGPDPGPGHPPGDHPHPPGPDPHPHDDWPAIRLAALIGSLSPEGVAEFRQKAADHLAASIRDRSDFLAGLPEAEREARISTFVNWSVDHALEAENGHSHGPEPWKPITDPGEQLLLQNQLAAASTVIPLYPTAADAEAAGYHQVTPYIPGIAAHYINIDLVDRAFDPAAPEMLLYNGNSSSSRIVGVSYAMFGEPPGPEDGFAGDNDSWHEHPSLCIISGFVIGPDHTPQDLCESVGAGKPNIRLHMSHLWQVADFQSAWGLFSGENPSVNMATSDLMNE